jgi:hypothetical protein
VVRRKTVNAPSASLKKKLAVASEPEPKTKHHYMIQFNPLKPSGNYMSHQLQQTVTLHFVFMRFV